jgi:hypothetical protein
VGAIRNTARERNLQEDQPQDCTLKHRHIIRKSFCRSSHADLRHSPRHRQTLSGLTVLGLTLFLLNFTSIHARGQAVNQNTHGTCAPTIAEVTGNVTITCSLVGERLRENATSNLEHCLTELGALLVSQSFYLVPAMAEYHRNPSLNSWAVARDRVISTQRRVQAAIESAIDFDASLADTIGPDLKALHSVLLARSVLLASIPADPPGSAWVDSFNAEYRPLIERLREQLRLLKSQLSPPNHGMRERLSMPA